MADTAPTRTFRLLDVVLESEGGLRHFVESRRDKRIAWRVISRDLFVATGFDVSDVSLRKWFKNGNEDAA